MTKLEERHARGRKLYGDKYDPSVLDNADPSIRDAYNSGARVRVAGISDTNETYSRTGTIGCTTGWRPAFLVMHRSNSLGSWDVIQPNDYVVAVQRGRAYVAVTS